MSAARVSVARKLGLLLALNTFLAVVTIAAVFTVGTAYVRYQDARGQLLALAQVTGENSRAAIAFNDPESARNSLRSLRLKGDVDVARLFDAAGQPFAEVVFANASGAQLAFWLNALDRVLPATLSVVHPILEEGATIGSIELQAHLSEIWVDLLHGQAVMALIATILGALAVTRGIRLSRRVVAPILALKETAQQVSTEQDYAVRARKYGDDEIGDLVTDFNRMLAEIQKRDGALELERAALQQRTLDMQQARDEAQRANQIKSEFLSTVSHELRTPLTAISGSLGLVSAGAMGALPTAVQGMLSIAQKNSQRLTYLINDLLDMEKLMAGKLNFDLQAQALMPLIEQSLADNGAYAEPLGVSLVLTKRCDDAIVCVDAQRLQQVMANLLSNAAKFSSHGSAVEVAVDRRGSAVRVTVIDHGSGVPTEFHSRIFQKFSQADASDTRQKGGTGLGLAITRELVEHMGGQVGFDSILGQGAHFYFELPASKAETTRPAELAPPSQSLSSAPRLLVVEDDKDVARLLALMLGRAGYLVDCTDRGKEALRLCSQHRYAAITLDLVLPDMHGLDVLRALRHRPDSAEMPVVVVTAHVQESRLVFDGDGTGIEWLAKPMDVSQLLAALQRLVQVRSVSPRRVLHVEDDAVIHEVVRGMAGQGFAFEHAANLREARARVALERFDVVLLDLSLPNESGWDLLPDIRRQQPEARVVILSEVEVLAAQAGHADLVLRKTQISPRDLVFAINGPESSASCAGDEK